MKLLLTALDGEDTVLANTELLLERDFVKGADQYCYLMPENFSITLFLEEARRQELNKQIFDKQNKECGFEIKS